MDRNFILALTLTILIFVGWDMMVVGPKREAAEAIRAQEAAAAAEAAGQPAGADQSLAATAPTTRLSREDALSQSAARLKIDTPEIVGSLNLRGLTFDDVTLKNYHVTYKDDSPLVTLLSPSATAGAQYLRAGLLLNGTVDNTALWEVVGDAQTLTPETPVTLRRQDTGNGIEHTVTLRVDDQFMFNVEHQVINQSGEDVTLQPYGASFQNGIPDDLKNFMILFEGPLAFVGDQLHARKYKKILNDGGLEATGVGGWAGITDKYWLGAVIPPQDQPFQAKLEHRPGATPLFVASYLLDPITVPNGQGTRIGANVFIGAKEVGVLRDYQKSIEKGGLNISHFDMAVDWGNFFFLTRPILATLRFFAGIVGNYGVAILLLTLCIKAVLFPLANMSYKSMAGMRKVQPEMQRLRERYKDDQMKMQQEVMALYKKHKINPAAGCLPILAQMPIFYALYKTLFTTIEMRHEAFLYIPDLSENDPTTIFNLFGLLPFDPTALPVFGAFLGIGILPLIMGAAMWVQMKLNPPPTDPVQAKIFAFMPLIFMFMFAPFAAGLVLYWAWNTILSVTQQYIIMKRQGADVDIIGNIRQSFGMQPAAANENRAGK